MTFEKIDPKENMGFKELRLLTQRGLGGAATLSYYFYVKPQVFPPHPHPVIPTCFLHTPGLSQVAYLLQPSIDLASCHSESKGERSSTATCHISEVPCDLQTVLFTKDTVIS